MLHISPDELTALITDHSGPCVSFYQATHRRHPEAQQDAIQFKNQVRDVRTSLSQKYGQDEIETIMAKFEALSHDREFWKHRTEGLAIFASFEMFETFDVHQPVKNFAVVADSFHLKPLFQVLQSSGRYHVLAINLHEAKLYIGDRDSMHQVPIVNMPSTITDALGDDLTEEHLGWGVTGGRSGQGRGGVQVAHHGIGQRKDEVEIDMVRFFRVIDRGILENYTRPSQLPLMLAALTEHHTEFRAVSHNPNLMEDGLHINTDALTVDQLREESWKIAESKYKVSLEKLSENYGLAKSKKLGSDSLAQIAKAAIEGRVATLLVEADREIGGKVDRVSGKIKTAPLDDPSVDDVLDDLAVMVMRTKGEVIVLPKEQMPSETGAAATFRF